MGVIIHESPVLAQLIPEIHYSRDPDAPLDMDLQAMPCRRHSRKQSLFNDYLGQLILRAFYYHDQATPDRLHYDPEWLTQLRKDPVLIQLAVVQWVDILVLDADGTFILTTEDPLHA